MKTCLVRNILLLTAGLFIWLSSYSQKVNIQFYMGSVFTFGTHCKNIGISVGTSAVYANVQLHTKLTGRYNLSTLGPSVKGFETQLTAGILYGLGALQKTTLPIYAPVTDNLHRMYALGYWFTIYLDEAQTSQRTGTFILKFSKLYMVTENDIFAQPSVDKFRTAAAQFVWILPKTYIAISTVLWTGNPKHQPTITDSLLPFRFGYRNLSKGKYGKYSNGILSLNVGYTAAPHQQFCLKTGIDSEKVRNVFQNKLIHDMYFIPAKWNKAQNPSYPMLDTNGLPFLNRGNQKIKPAKFFLQAEQNGSIFY